MNRLNIQFWLRKNPTQKKLSEKDLALEKIPIYCKIIVNSGLPVNISTGEKIERSRWDNQRISGSKPDAKIINDRLDNMRNGIKGALNKLEEQGEQVTSKILADAYAGKSSRVIPTLLNLYTTFLSDCTELVDKKELAPRTLEMKINFKKNMALFIKDVYHDKDIILEHMLMPNKAPYKLIYDFMHWGKTKEITQGDEVIKEIWGHNYCVKQLVVASQIISFGVAGGYTSRNPLAKKIPRPKKTPPKFLDVQDVDAIENPKKPLTSEVLSTIQDVFLFCCYTGLAFTEVEALTHNDIAIVLDEKLKDNEDFTNYWIFIKRQKTMNSSARVCKIPLLKKAYVILEKYRNHPKCINKGICLPVISNVKYNEYLKVIQAACEIVKHLTTHVARHTCARIFLDAGFSKEFVAEMFGHTTTEYIGTIYAEISTSRMSNEIERVSKQSNVAFQ